MKKVTQTFTKGINQRIDRSGSSPDRFQTLQNARIFKRGDSLDVARIEGYERWPLVDSEQHLASTARPADFDTDDFQRGFFLSFTEGVRTFDADYIPQDLELPFAPELVFIEDLLRIAKRSTLQLTDGVQVGDRLPRRPRIQPLLNFVDGLEISSVGDNLSFNAFVRLSFTDGVEVRDTPICG
jgi:hypothetical protein